MGKCFMLLFWIFLLASSGYGQTNPVIISWIQNTTGQTNPSYPSLECNVQSVYYTSDSAYISCSSIPGYVIGPWTANPNVPADMNFVCKFPVAPTVNTGTKTNVGLGVIGLWKNGVSVFNAKDGKYWNNATQQMVNGITFSGWNRNALYWEGISFDSCKGHPGPNSNYHHHVTPKCLYNQFDSTNHAPLLGFAWDGFPIYRPYTYTNTNGTGAIKRMKSSYVLTTSGSRSLGPPVNSTYPWGSMCEDYVYSAGAGDLDQYNGRFGNTPEYPGGIYAYFVTISADGTPQYPFVLGSQYYGKVASTLTNQSIPSSAVKYDAPPLPIVLFNFTVQLKGNDAFVAWKIDDEDEIVRYEIEKSSDASQFVSIFTQEMTHKTLYGLKDGNLPSGQFYYRLRMIHADGSIKYSQIASVSVQGDSKLLIHNNPAGDILTIQNEDALQARTVRLFDVQGREVFQTIMDQGITMISIDVQTYYAGIYVLTVSNPFRTLSSKLVISK